MRFISGAEDRNRTGTIVKSQDFKSCASASSATQVYLVLKKPPTQLCWKPKMVQYI